MIPTLLNNLIIGYTGSISHHFAAKFGLAPA
jgi:hypothetical protein